MHTNLMKTHSRFGVYKLYSNCIISYLRDTIFQKGKIQFISKWSIYTILNVDSDISIPLIALKITVVLDICVQIMDMS